MTSVSSVKLTPDSIIDLFRGPGGWSTGLAALGRRDYGVEWDKTAHETAAAAGHDGILADVTELDPHKIGGDSLEGLIASPPCPGFSAAGLGLGRQDLELLIGSVEDIASGRDPRGVLETVRARQHDKRSALTLEPLRWIVDLEPEWVALEQVPAVLPLWEAYATALEGDGYNVWTGNVQAEQYGVPQTRKRAILLASRTRRVGRPTPTHSKFYPRSPLKLDTEVAKWVSMAEALGWGMTQRPSMTVTGGGTGAGGAEPFGNAARQGMVREFEAGRWAEVRGMLSAGGNNTAGQRERPPGEPSATITGKGTAYWQIVPAIDGETAEDCLSVHNRPAPTIVGSFHPEVVAKPGYRKAGDPPRQKTPGSVRVTVQEAAVLQAFPPDYPWQGSKTAQYRQVGDAVPPLLAAHVLASLGVGVLPVEAVA